MKNGRFYTDYLSPLGRIRLAGDGGQLTGLWFEGQQHFAATLAENAEAAELEVFQLARQWLDAYFAGSKQPISFPLSPCGTPFQQAVWRLLQEIPPGETRTYGELARILSQAGGISSLNGNAMAENSRSAPQVGFNQGFLKKRSASLICWQSVSCIIPNRVGFGKYRWHLQQRKNSETSTTRQQATET